MPTQGISLKYKRGIIMKAVILPLVLAGIFSASTFAATQINNSTEKDYVSIGNISFSQDGFDGGSDNLSKKADVMCKEISNVSSSDCFYKVVSTVGRTDFKTINIEIFKKK